MFCIAAFIVLAIISIFSASHRKLAAKAWGCTFRKITFRPCDTSFKEETKSKLLSKVANRSPKLIKAADVGIEIASALLVVLTIWSLLTALEAGLNLFVWGTCNPNQASSCSLTSETCSIDKTKVSFWEYLGQGKPWMWFVDGTGQLIETFGNIPNRLKHWEAVDYLPKNVSYYYEKDDAKPTALEILDPGCSVCGRLFKNIKEAGFENRYNLAYIAYPIKDIKEQDAYKFKNSYIVTSYLEAIKLNPKESLKTPADWQIIERIFTWKASDGFLYQSKINNDLEKDQVVELLHDWLKDIGYSEEEITKIDLDVTSSEVKSNIEANEKIVEDKVNTLKIPTIIYDGKRNDGLADVSDLK